MKKFITIALAVAVLFSFAACQNQTPVTGLVERVVATQTETYVAGEKVTAEGFTYVGYTSLGNEVAVSASDITLDNGTVIAVDGAPVKINYQGKEVGSLTIEAETVTRIVSVDTSALPTLYAAPAYAASGTVTVLEGAIDRTTKPVDYELITVDVEYEGGTKEDVALTSATYDLNSQDFATSGEKTLKAKFGTVEEGFKVKVEENLITSVTLEQTEGYILYYTDSAKGLTYAENVGKQDETAGVYVVLGYQSGEKVYLDETSAADDSAAIVTWTAGGIQQTKFSDYKAEDDETVSIQAKFNGTLNIASGLDRNSGTIGVSQIEDVLDFDTLEISGYIAKGDYSADATSKAAMSNGIKFVVKYKNPKTTAKTYSSSSSSAAAGTDNVQFVNEALTTAGNYFTMSEEDFSKKENGDRVSVIFSGRIGTETFSGITGTLIIGTAPVAAGGGDQ